MGILEEKNMFAIKNEILSHYLTWKQISVLFIFKPKFRPEPKLEFLQEPNRISVDH